MLYKRLVHCIATRCHLISSRGIVLYIVVWFIVLSLGGAKSVLEGLCDIVVWFSVLPIGVTKSALEEVCDIGKFVLSELPPGITKSDQDGWFDVKSLVQCIATRCN